MARVFRYSHNREGRRSAGKLIFEGTYEPDIYFDGINAVSLDIENDTADGKGITVTFTKEEAQQLRRKLDSEGL